MASLSSLVKRFEDGDSRLRKLVQLYRSAIAAVRDRIVVTRPGARTLLRVRFDRLLGRIDRWPGGDGDISESLTVLSEILNDYRAGEELVFAEEQRQLRKTVASLSSLAESLFAKHRERGQELEAVATALENALYEPDSMTIHTAMQQQIRVLKSTIVALSESAHDAANAIARETGGLSAITQSEAPGGPVEIGQAQRTEQALRDHIAHFEVFCAISAEISGLDEIERAWGLPAREQVFVEFQKRIERCMGDTKAVQLWNGPRVTVVNNSAAILANQRLNKLRVLLAKPFCLVSAVGDVELRLPMRTGMIEYGGEAVDVCMHRIEESLYEHHVMAV